MNDLPSQLSNDLNILAQYKKDPVYEGSPEYVFRGQDIKTTSEILEWAHHKKMPITFCGSQTAMTGSGVADKGITLTLNKMDRLLDIGIDSKTKEPFAICEPGILLGDFKNKVWQDGFFYPPDPTSYLEARLGGTVATNATGSDTFKYGPTRLYVEELDVLLCDGSQKKLTRTKPLHLTHAKNKAGYFLEGEEIDQVIGSEGTLALITKIKIKLLSNKGRNLFYLVLPFSSFQKSLEGVLELLKLSHQPRAIELIGPGAAEYFRQAPSCPTELKNENCFLYLKDEFDTETDLQKKLESWFKNLKSIYKNVDDTICFQRIFAATTEKQHQDLHACRHHIPLKVNEDFFPYTKFGGGKIGTDWWIPSHHLVEMMLSVYKDAQKNNVPFLVFGHIGNGHPHWDFLCKTKEEFLRTKELVKKHCQKAALYGGGVAGEHGIGKIKRDLLLIQHSPKIIQKMKELKTKWDPHWIFGPGNLFI